MGAWNLLGDLYYMDFFTAHLSDEAFGMIQEEQQAGYLFQFHQGNQWLVFLVQAGGWMYPIWAMATAIPLCIGFQEDNTEIGATLQPRDNGSSGLTHGELSWRNCRAIAPIALLVYGLCVVGGAFHSAFAFVTVLPNVAHYPPDNTGGGGNDNDGWFDLVATEQFALVLETAQTRILQYIFVGALPGLVACNISSIWIALLVQFRSQCHRFPKWFNLFNPITTTIWVQALGSILPYPVGFYLAGCLGTWSFLFLNLGTTYCLWNLNGNGETKPRSPLLQQSRDNGRPDYKSVS